MDEKTFNLDLIEPKYPDDYYISIKENESKVVFLSEATQEKYNPSIRKFLYGERIKVDRVILNRYKEIKASSPKIKFTYIKPELYKGDNLFVDLTYYHEIFIRNNIYEGDRAIKLYFDFICRLLDVKDLKDNGYTDFTVLVPVDNNAWGVKPGTDITNYKENINIFSTINRMLRLNPILLQEEFSKYNFIFINDKGYFTVDFKTFELKNISRFITNINTMLDEVSAIIPDEEDKKDSTNAIVSTLVDRLEDNTGIKIDNIAEKPPENKQLPKIKTTNISSQPIVNPIDISNNKKKELVKSIKDKVADARDTEEAIDNIDSDEEYSKYIKDIIDSIADEEDNSVKISATRSARLDTVNKKFLNSTHNGKTVAELLSANTSTDPLPKSALNIDTVNDEWKELQFVNFNKKYDLDADIMKIITCFNDKSTKVGVLEVKTEDTSTSEDYIETYTVNMEDEYGKRFTIKFDVPKLKNDRFMRLRGNEKTISGQLVLLPVIKTDEDTAQIVSNYNKIFIRRYGNSTGKSYITADKIIKAFTKNSFEFPGIKVTTGNNERISQKYDLPIDYIDLSSVFTKIETDEYIIYFDQNEIRDFIKKNGYKAPEGIPFAYNKKSNSIVVYTKNDNYPFSVNLLDLLSSNKEFMEAVKLIKPSTKYTYSKASILNNTIPVIVILGYSIGLISAMNRAGVEYYLSETRDKNRISSGMYDDIKFNDGYITYAINYSSSLLMNGLKECDTANYSLKDLDSKAMWLDFLDNFGGRILCDGLDNFVDLMVDPITEEVCKKYNLPTNYFDQLIYANNLLADNKFNKHVDITGKRYRSNEIIAGYVYKVLAKSYGDYKTKMKRSRQESTMTLKRSAVIDAILLDPTASDLSILNPLLEMETANNVTFKGLSGMNSDRSYGLDKRTYDDSMINLLALSTGFAANVGINRLATIDMNIEGSRGYIKQTTNTDDMSITKTFSMTEALTPFGTTRDDPFRSAMTFIQTSKHGMRTTVSSPQLITNGADEALPYLTSDTFSFKAKMDGKPIEINDDYILVEYIDGSKDYINLKEKVMKNSDGGFYITINLIPNTNIRLDKKFKANEILAYDPKSFSNTVGPTDNIAYNIGTLAKVAILNTDEGFEDSTIVSDWISEAMSSEVVVLKDYVLPKNTNLYYMVTPGMYVQEGEPLLVFQNAFEEDDINILLKNITSEEDFVSDLGRIPVLSKVTGIIQDINIYRTVEKEELSDSLRAVVDKYESKINKTKNMLKRNNILDVSSVEPTQTLEATGKLKNAKDSVYIEIYIKYYDKLSIGDKIVATSAAKGVVKDIFPKGNEPTSEFRPNENIHAFFANGSFNARMISSVTIQGSINKALIELGRSVKDIMDIPYTIE